MLEPPSRSDPRRDAVALVDLPLDRHLRHHLVHLERYRHSRRCRCRDCDCDHRATLGSSQSSSADDPLHCEVHLPRERHPRLVPRCDPARRARSVAYRVPRLARRSRQEHRQEGRRRERTRLGQTFRPLSFRVSFLRSLSAQETLPRLFNFRRVGIVWCVRSLNRLFSPFLYPVHRLLSIRGCCRIRV